jgi:hypothetical protein
VTPIYAFGKLPQDSVFRHITTVIGYVAYPVPLYLLIPTLLLLPKVELFSLVREMMLPLNYGLLNTPIVMTIYNGVVRVNIIHHHSYYTGNSSSL